ncbi:MAG: hypothetical protein WCV68_04295 [Candidatus Paceibacterota bacterium]
MTKELPPDPTTISPGDDHAVWEVGVKRITEQRNLLVREARSSGVRDWDVVLENFVAKLKRDIEAISGLSEKELSEYAAYHAAVGSSPDYKSTPKLDLPGDLISEVFDMSLIREKRKILPHH